jgi:ABC-type nitrate/sulfonate/bicarbonate transport system substrate-binding protein
VYAVKKWIDTNGGDSKLSKYVEIPLPEMASAVALHRVDASSMDSANLVSNPDLRLLGDTYHSVSPRFIAGVWFATPSWIAEHTLDVKNFVTSIRSASDWANKNHDAAVKIYAKYSRFTLTDLQSSPRPTFVTSTRPDLLQPVIDLAAQYGAIKSAFPARDLLSSLAE